MRSEVLEFYRLEFEFQLCHALAVQFWASYLSFDSVFLSENRDSRMYLEKVLPGLI